MNPIRITVRLGRKSIQTLLLALIGLTAAYSNAEVQPIDKVAAVVNDDVIMQSQVEELIQEFIAISAERGQPTPPDDVMLRQAMEQLIIESIQLQLGEQYGVRVDDATLNQYMERLAERYGMNLAQYQQALAAQNQSYEALREQVRKQRIIARIQEGIVGRRITVTDQEIRNFLASEAGKAQLEAEYRIGHILIQIPEETSEEEKARLREKADRIYRELEQGADFAQLATAESDASDAAAGGDLGWRKEAQLPSIYSEIATQLNDQEVSQPFASPNGLHILKLFAKRGGDSVMVPQYKVRHILIEPSEIRDEEAAQALAKSLKERIQNGEDFATLAKKHSADTGSLASGGVMDWMTLDVFVPEFSEVVEKTEVNTLSEPFRTRFGWHILEVMDTREQDLGTEIKRSRAEKIIYDRKFEEELEIWLREERAQAYVDIKVY